MPGLEGIVPILLTPFTDDFAIDHEALAREVEATLEAGVHGIGIAIGSEIFKLTPEERRATLATVVARVAGRVPVVMNTSAPGTAVAVQLAVEAAEGGATRLMIWPPDFFPTGPDAVIAHLSAIAQASGLPIVLQDVPQSPIPAALALRIRDAVPLVDTIKVETQPTVGQVAKMTDALDGGLTVLGGAGGGTLVEEFRRGGRGTMPFASQARDFMAAWTCLGQGDEAGAEAIIEQRILPVSRFGFQSGDMFYHVHKAILMRRGVFPNARVRPPTAPPDPVSAGEMARLLDRMDRVSAG